MLSNYTDAENADYPQRSVKDGKLCYNSYPTVNLFLDSTCMGSVTEGPLAGEPDWWTASTIVQVARCCDMRLAFSIKFSNPMESS